MIPKLSIYETQIKRQIALANGDFATFLLLQAIFYRSKRSARKSGNTYCYGSLDLAGWCAKTGLEVGEFESILQSLVTDGVVDFLQDDQKVLLRPSMKALKYAAIGDLTWREVLLLLPLLKPDEPILQHSTQIGGGQ